YGYRLRLILCENDPTILGVNQDFWVAALRHNEREPAELVEIFRTLRQFNLAVWRRTSPEDLKRAGQHNERGPEPLGVMLRLPAATFRTLIRSLVTFRPFSSGSSAAARPSPSN